MAEQSAKVLLADDEQDQLMMLSFYLQRAGFIVFLAENGPEALEKTFSEKPDLVLLDRMMPGMDGIEVCRQIRQKDSSIYIVMVTAMGTEADRIQGLEAGADDYLIKPYNNQELVLRIKAMLRRPRPHQAGNVTTPPGTTQPGNNPVPPGPGKTQPAAAENPAGPPKTPRVPDRANFQVVLETFLRDAHHAAQASDVERARELYQRALKVDPANEQALMWLAWYTKDPYEGVGYLERLVAAHPENTRAREFLEAGRRRIQELDRLISDSSVLSYWTTAEKMHQDRVRKGQDRRSNPLKPLGQMLLQKGFITTEQLETAIHISEMFTRLGTPRKLGEIMIEYGYLTKEQLDDTLMEQWEDYESQFY